MTGEPKFPSAESPYAKLEVQPEIVEIIKPKIDTTEFKLRVDELETVENTKYVQKSIDAVKMPIAFLDTPMIVDEFVEHSKRYEWLGSLADSELSKLYHKNKLRRNFLNSVPLTIKSFKMGFLEDETVRTYTNQQSQKVQDLLDTQEDKSLPTKSQLVDELEAIIVETIQDMLDKLSRNGGD